MRRNLTKLLMLFMLFLPFTVLAQNTQTFTLDPNHSYVSFHISHFGFSSQTGKWFTHGTLVLNKDKPQDSKVDVTINVADMDTGLPELNKHLKSPLFFDVDKFPTATFVSDKIVVTGKKTAKVMGILTLHGISKPITLNVMLNKAGISPVSNKETVGFAATTTLERSDFGITTALPGLGDDVTINIEAEAYAS